MIQQFITQAQLNAVLAAHDSVLMDKWFPVGTVVRQQQGEPTPAQKFGMGTWTLDTTHGGRMEMGADDTYPLGSTGGSADAIVVSHGHKVALETSNTLAVGGGADETSLVLNFTEHKTPYVDLRAVETGESGVGKNIPPYLAINYWKRIA